MLGDIISIIVFIAIIVIGFILWRYTKRYLDAIDGFGGVVSKKERENGKYIDSL